MYMQITHFVGSDAPPVPSQRLVFAFFVENGLDGPFIFGT